MPADVPPPPPQPPAALSPQQQRDLECLRVGVFLHEISRGQGGTAQGDRLIRLYLPRLQHSGDDRDWLALAKPEQDIDYGKFLVDMDRCLPRRLR